MKDMQQHNGPGVTRPNRDECRVIVAVFGPDQVCLPSDSSMRMVYGEGQMRMDTGMLGRVHALLNARGLEVLRVEQSSEPSCFSALIHARTHACGAQNVVALRKELEAAGRELGVTIRVQREELFVYMHRV